MKNQINHSLLENSTFCYELPISIGNSTFCGLNRIIWTQRYKHPMLLGMTITPVVIYWIIQILLIKGIYQNHLKLWRKHNELKNHGQHDINMGCVCFHCGAYKDRICFRFKTYFTMVVLVMFKFLWDGIDLTLDVYIFYQLEKGEVLDSGITRNITVNSYI